MKIIDNKKDYYDYLQGINGIDELKVYDRRGSVNPINELQYFTNDFPDVLKGDKKLRYYLTVGDEFWSIQYEKNHYWIEDEPGEWTCNHVVDHKRKPDDPPIKLEIFEKSEYHYYYSRICKTWQNPILKDLPIIRKFVKPDDIWNALYEYFGRLKDGDYVDSRSDIQKLESAGFDKKTSFRNIK